MVCAIYILLLRIVLQTPRKPCTRSARMHAFFSPKLLRTEKSFFVRCCAEFLGRDEKKTQPRLEMPRYFQQCNPPSPRHGRDHGAPPWLSFAPDGAIHRQKYAETARSLSFTRCPWRGQHGIKSSVKRWRHSGRRRHASKLRGATLRGARMLAVVCGALTFFGCKPRAPRDGATCGHASRPARRQEPNEGGTHSPLHRSCMIMHDERVLNHIGKLLRTFNPLSWNGGGGGTLLDTSAWLYTSLVSEPDNRAVVGTAGVGVRFNVRVWNARLDATTVLLEIDSGYKYLLPPCALSPSLVPRPRAKDRSTSYQHPNPTNSPRRGRKRRGRVKTISTT